jgi:hypothetical protein
MAQGPDNRKIRIVNEGSDYIPSGKLHILKDRSGYALDAKNGERYLILGDNPGIAHAKADVALRTNQAIDARGGDPSSYPEPIVRARTTTRSGHKDPKFSILDVSSRSAAYYNFKQQYAKLQKGIDASAVGTPLTTYTGVISKLAYEGLRAYEQKYLGDGPTVVHPYIDGKVVGDPPTVKDMVLRQSAREIPYFRTPEARARRLEHSRQRDSRIAMGQSTLPVITSQTYHGQEMLPSNTTSSLLESLRQSVMNLLSPISVPRNAPAGPGTLINQPIHIADNSVNILSIRAGRGGTDVPRNAAILAALPQAANAVATMMQSQNHDGRVSAAMTMAVRNTAIANMSQAAAQMHTSETLSKAAVLLQQGNRVDLKIATNDESKTEKRAGLLTRLLTGERTALTRRTTTKALEHHGALPGSSVHMVLPDFVPTFKPTVIQSASAVAMSFNPKSSTDFQPDYRAVSSAGSAAAEGRGSGIAMAASAYDVIGGSGYESHGGGVDITPGSADFKIDWK